jgi:hypothetical protein
MTALPLAPASEFAIAGWLPARIIAVHTPEAHSSRVLRAVIAMNLHWLHRGTVLPLCEPTD